MEERRRLYKLNTHPAASGLPAAEAARLRREEAELCVVYASWAVLEPEQDSYSDSAYEALRSQLIRLASLGIEPVLCLYRGEAPDWFRVRGGWELEDDLRFYLRFVGKTVRSVGHLVSRYITVASPDELARRGKLLSPRALSHMAAGHIRACRLIRDTRAQRGWGESVIGFALRLRTVSAVHKRFLGEGELLQTALLRAMTFGKFTPPLLNPLHIKPGDYGDFLAVYCAGEEAEALCLMAEGITGKPAFPADH